MLVAILATVITDGWLAYRSLRRLDALGGPKVDNMYHAGWAWAAAGAATDSTTVEQIDLLPATGTLWTEN